MTTDVTKTFEDSALIESRELDLTAGTFTRRDGQGAIVEQRPLNVAELATLNRKLEGDIREGRLLQARTDTEAIAGNGPIKRVLGAILDELEDLR